jgi:hypothetical protein
MNKHANISSTQKGYNFQRGFILIRSNRQKNFRPDPKIFDPTRPDSKIFRPGPRVGSGWPDPIAMAVLTPVFHPFWMKLRNAGYYLNSNHENFICLTKPKLQVLTCRDCNPYTYNNESSTIHELEK